ncbi:thiamine-phosphate pyrophosphorylase [Corynebacterium aquilae DSM 44791]|uniref:Thiamine-phosphate synthase n=1 Tax=Corynebacterium aquilae DSM 44791 TaxID=1431546 RepID=A0A1L7CDA6_9CORY|nr:thiamine-phosphate pyrophosphorylase [Corynebacterium aquilae DSM 44791]
MYLVTSGHDQHTVDVAAQVAAAGAGVVQVRAKDITTRELLALTKDVLAAVREANPATAVVVDDRADVALAAGADGVHLGQDDLPPSVARQMLGPDAIIGLTTGTLELVQQAQAFHTDNPGVLDYIGAGPFRPTPTKDSGRQPLWVDGYPPLVAATSLPIVAIGDVTVEDVADLSATGIAGVAMVRCLMNADDPHTEASRALALWRGRAYRDY